jgi:ADP-heptose:LPS heptosyltransferase
MGRSVAQTHPGEAERGLRGWAKQVYTRFPGSQLVTLRSRKPEVRSSKLEVSHLPSPISHLPSPISHLPSPTPSRILIFRIGQLGDTIVALPAIWAVKKHFPNAIITLLCDRHPGKKYVLASDLFRGTGIFDEFLSYPVSENGNILKPWRMASLLAAIKRRRFDTLVYLAPTSRSPEQILRDRRFFALAGIREFIGMEGFTFLQPKDNDTPLAEVRPESDLLLKRLVASDLPVAPVDQATMDLVLGDTEAAAVEQWRKTLPPDGGRPWVAVAPGSKMPAKRWPLHRFETVIQQLITRFDIWPVVFGGSEDQQIGDRLIRAWDRGYNAAGALGLRPAIAALKRCAFFLGNDTGTMHMAASVGIRCVAIFSSRDRPGLWYPQGPGHKIFRTAIECEGCGLSECLEKKNQCLDAINVPEVLEACSRELGVRRTEDRGWRTEAEKTELPKH